jgi:hypothetical protein
MMSEARPRPDWMREKGGLWLITPILPTDYDDYGGDVERWSDPHEVDGDCSTCKWFVGVDPEWTPKELDVSHDWGVCGKAGAPRAGLLTWEHQAGRGCMECEDDKEGDNAEGGETGEENGSSAVYAGGDGAGGEDEGREEAEGFQEEVNVDESRVREGEAIPAEVSALNDDMQGCGAFITTITVDTYDRPGDGMRVEALVDERVAVLSMTPGDARRLIAALLAKCDNVA